MLQAYPPKGDTALVGDSLVARMRSTAFLGEGYANYGVGSSNPLHLLTLAPTIKANARQAMILVGINALAQKRSADDVAQDIRRLCKALALPVIVVPTLPIREGTDGVSNATIRELRARLAGLPLAATPSIEVDGQLAAHFTRDGIHLTVAGYEALMKDLKPVLASNLWAVVT